MKTFLFLLSIIVCAACNNASVKDSATITTDSNTIVSKDTLVPVDTDDHNMGTVSTIALDSPVGPRIKDSVQKH